MEKINNPFKKLESKKAFNIKDFEVYKSKLNALTEQNTDTKNDLLAFIEARDELDKLYTNERQEAFFLKTIDTSNKDYRKNNEYIEQVITPLWVEYNQKFNTKVLNSPAIDDLEPKYKVLKKKISNELELFNKNNIGLEKQINIICSEITEIHGGLTANWEGKKLPLTMIYPHMRSTKRETRKNAYKTVDQSILEVSGLVDQKFDELLKLRNQVAKNAGFKDFIDFRFKQMKRFDWGRSDCYAFHKAVKKHIVPVGAILAKKKKANLGLDSYKYYDRHVHFEGLEPLVIYDKENLDPFVEGTGKIIKAIDEELYGYFKVIKDNKLLDLDARENKANIGYMCNYPVYELASVFYGGSGSSDDLLVLLHELGHCFHYFLGKHIKPFALQEWTSEVAEGGSMSMEYIGLENMKEYLDPEACKRIKGEKLRSVINIFVYCSLGDEFQHWIYENPNHTSDDRQRKYVELLKEYHPEIDYDGQENLLGKIGWQFHHILQAPFYLIDYAISELLALSIWDRYKKDPEEGLKYYKAGCSLAGSKSVKETYQAFGTSLNFSEEVIAPLADRLKEELNLFE